MADSRLWIPTKEDLILVYDKKRNGIRNDTIARLLGITPQTFQKKINELPELADTIKKAEAYVEEEVLGALFAMIRDPKHKGHVPAVFFYCKTRLGMKETAEQPIIEKPSEFKYNVISTDKKEEEAA